MTRGSSAARGSTCRGPSGGSRSERRRRPVTVRDLVLVDADLGNVALSFSEIEDAKNRIVCNAESEPKLVPCTALEAELKEGDDPTAAAPEAALAYTLTGDLYDFYKDNFGRDSIDGAGMPLISTVSYCEPKNARSKTPSGTASRWSTATAWSPMTSPATS